MDILTGTIQEEEDDINLDDITPRGPTNKTQTNGHNNKKKKIQNERKQEENEDEEDEDEEDEDEEEDEDQEDIDNEEEEEEEEESFEQKESSESPQNKSVSIEEEDEKEREEPQRKKKRKRARRRRKKDDDDNKEEFESQTEPKAKAIKKKKKLSLSDELKYLDLRDVQSSRKKLNEWLQLLQNDVGKNNGFLNRFASVNGAEIIVEKVVLNNSGSNHEYNALILSLFDFLLYGRRDYHEWLINKLMKLQEKLKDLSVSSSSKSNHSDLVSIITSQARNLVRTQTKKVRISPASIVMNRDESFSLPSHLLHGGHQEKDPIVPVLSSLDDEVSTLSDLYNTLLMHDSSFSSFVSTHDLSGYVAIKSVLRENITIIGHKSASLEEQLFAMKNEQNDLSKHKDLELMDIRQRLENRKSEKYRLLAEKKRIEAELLKINESLQKNDMLQEEANVAMLEITNGYSPKMESLYESMHDHQFEIAGYAQESSCFSLLLQMTQESFNLLDSFRDNLDIENNQRRNELENNYINHLARYLDKLCDAAMMVCNRQNELKQHIESFKKTNETTNKYYALSLNITQQLSQYKNMLNVDEKTNVNISANIRKNIEKAQKIVSTNLFNKFVNHLKQNPQIASVIDLAKYTKENKNKNNNVNSSNNNVNNKGNKASVSQPRIHSTHTTHAHNVATHSHSQSPHSQQINGRSKPPFIKNKATNIRRPPRPHYQQPQSQNNTKRRPPTHNKYHPQF